MKPYRLPKSEKQIKQLKSYLPDGTHYSWSLPIDDLLEIPFVRGKGSRLWDVDGNEYLDLACKFGAMIVGHNNPRYNEALKQQVDTVLSVTNSGLESALCELLARHIPGAEMMRFGLSGTEIVQNAIRLARAYTGKNRFVRFAEHYHGSADNIFGGGVRDPAFPVPEDSQDDRFPAKGRAKNVLEDQSFLLPWNDIQALEGVIGAYAHEIAAVIMEPICINGGGIFPGPGYLERVRELCNTHHIVLIFDEILTGFRIGLGGAQALLKVIPDLTVLGKAMAGGGVPASAILGKREILKLYENENEGVFYVSTYNGYPLGLAAVMATLEILSEQGCYGQMEGYLSQMTDALSEAADDAGIPLVVQGPRTCPVYHCREEVLETPDDYSEAAIVRDFILGTVCERYGILTSPISVLYGNVMMNAQDVDFFRARIGEALKDAKRELRSVDRYYQAKNLAQRGRNLLRFGNRS